MIRANGISKRFGITQALDDVTVEFAAGEVHALMGENGAGKSTLGKVMAGLHRQDRGVVVIDDQELRPGSIEASFAAGIRIVHQELAQCPNLSVAENLCLHEIPRTRRGTVDDGAMRERAARLVKPLEPSIDVTRPLGELSPGHRQICQIAGALDDERGGAHPARVIVFDEPTSSLSIAETERLMSIVRGLASDGLTVIYVSHRMSEIFACCDRVTVLRDGKYVATSRVAEITEADLVEQMIGRRIDTSAVHRASGEHGEVRLRVAGLSSPGLLDDVGLEVRACEIVGVGGLVGAGRSELLNAVFGLDRRASGRVDVCGRRLGRGPRAAIDAGVGYVPEDRRLQGLFLNLGLDENIVMPVMSALASGGVRRLGVERGLVRERMAEFSVKAASASSTPDELSGGNQQKLLIARWMSHDARVLLLDEPTRGIDVGTKSEIYRLVRRAADDGVGILLVSSEMPELLALSDRVLVMSEGRVRGELSGEAMTQSEILRLATQEESVAASGS